MISKLLIILDKLLIYKYEQEIIKNWRIYVANVDPKSLQPCKIMTKIADKYLNEVKK